VEVDRDSGRGWSGFVLVTIVVVTVLGGVLLTMSDARQAVSVASATEVLPAPTPTPTVAPTEGVVTVALPSPSPSPSPSSLPPSPSTPAVTPTLKPTVEPTSTPEPQPSSTPAVVLESCTPPSGWVPYTVRLGDTLFSLSRQSGVSLDEVREANCLSSDVLYPGSVLYLRTVPVRPMPGCGPPMDWVLYTVQRGDTLYSLATRRGATVSEVLFANCLTSVSISAGLGLYLPPVSSVPGVVASPTPATAGPAGTVCLITSPADGSQVSGAITLLGSATTEQFLFYKIEVSGPQTGGTWASLLGNVVYTPVTSGVLGTANLGGWEPGSYSVRLVVVDTTSNEVGACYLGLEVVSP
jgi:LysM repeat protein